MKKYSKEEVLRQYEESGKIMYQATLAGDYKANNKVNFIDQEQL